MSITQQVAESFNFTVDKFPLQGPDNAKTPHYGLFRSDTGECVGNAVRKTYNPHTTEQVCQLTEAAAGVFGEGCTARCYFWHGHYVTVAPPDSFRRSVFGTSDNIWPRLIIRAGYDGKSFFSQLAYYRDVCSNLALPQLAENGAFGKFRHSLSLDAKVEELRRSFERLAAGWDSVVETCRDMDAKQVSLAEFIRQVYPLPDDASRRTRTTYDNRVEKIITRVLRERQETGRPEIGDGFMVSAWEAFNGVQGYVQHDATRQGKPDEYRRAILALSDRAVHRALAVALAA